MFKYLSTCSVHLSQFARISYTGNSFIFRPKVVVFERRYSFYFNILSLFFVCTVSRNPLTVSPMDERGMIGLCEWRDSIQNHILVSELYELCTWLCNDVHCKLYLFYVFLCSVIVCCMLCNVHIYRRCILCEIVFFHICYVNVNMATRLN